MLQKNVTRNGTLKSTVNPWYIERITNSLPDTLLIIGRVVSMLVAPPEDIGASGPASFNRIGAPKRVIISRAMLASSATVPGSGPLYWVMNILDKE